MSKRKVESFDAIFFHLGEEFNSIRKLLLKKVSKEVVESLSDDEKEAILKNKDESLFGETDKDILIDSGRRSRY